MAFAVTIIPILVGLILARFATQLGWLIAPVRALAWSAVAMTVLFILLPEAMGSIGVWTFFAAAIGALAPSLLSRLLSFAGQTTPHHKKTTVFIGLITLALHQLVESAGIALLVLTESPTTMQSGIFVAIHTIPVVAVTLVACKESSGPKAMLYAALGLIAVTTVGVILAPTLIDAHFGDDFMPWTTSFLAGLMVHILLHDFSIEKSSKTRAGELLGFVLGIAVTSVAILQSFSSGSSEAHHEHAHEHAHSHDLIESVVDAFLQLIGETAVPLLIGLGVAGIFSWSFDKIPKSWFLGGSPLKHATIGAAVGTPVPVCSCGVLPIAETMRKKSAHSAFIFAILVATPEISFETVFLSWHFLGPELTVARVCGAVVLAVLGGWAFGYFVQAPANADRPNHSHDHSEHSHNHADHSHDHSEHSHGNEGFWSRYLRTIDDLAVHILPWLIASLVAASYCLVLLPQTTSGSGSLWFDMLIATVVVIPAYICAASATPLAASLIIANVSPAAAMVGLFLGSATNVATLLFFKNAYRQRGMIIAMVILIGLAWAVTIPIHYLELTVPYAAESVSHTESWHLIGLGLLLLVALRSLWRSGVDGWVHGLSRQSHHDHNH